MKKSTFFALFLIATGAFLMPNSQNSVLGVEKLRVLEPVAGGYEALQIPAQPEDLVATTFGDTAVLLQWKDRSDKEIAFDIHMVDADGKQGIRFVDPNVTRHVLGELKPQTEYQIRVRARGPYGHSEFSPFVGIKTGGGKRFMVAFD